MIINYKIKKGLYVIKNSKKNNINIYFCKKNHIIKILKKKNLL
ncbi:hypothetical protein [Candidatus Vidania fulgoroideorum]